MIFLLPQMYLIVWYLTAQRLRVHYTLIGAIYAKHSATD